MHIRTETGQRQILQPSSFLSLLLLLSFLSFAAPVLAGEIIAAGEQFQVNATTPGNQIRPAGSAGPSATNSS